MKTIAKTRRQVLQTCLKLLQLILSDFPIRVLVQMEEILSNSVCHEPIGLSEPKRCRTVPVLLEILEIYREILGLVPPGVLLLFLLLLAVCNEFPNNT